MYNSRKENVFKFKSEIRSAYNPMYPFNLKYILLLFICLSIVSCKKDAEPLDIVPVIEMVNISPIVANEYTDAIVIRIYYTDGDGDLGENNASIKNCFVTDNRIGITSSYRIKQLAPDGSSIPIKGLLDIEIGGQGITNGASQQNASFSLYIVDRSGHVSNTINTEVITIHKP